MYVCTYAKFVPRGSDRFMTSTVTKTVTLFKLRTETVLQCFFVRRLHTFGLRYGRFGYSMAPIRRKREKEGNNKKILFPEKGKNYKKSYSFGKGKNKEKKT